jgi:hypothetical protein
MYKVNQIDWATYAAAQLSRAIDLALRLELIASAADLAELGVNRFPDDRRLVQAQLVCLRQLLYEEHPPLNLVG